MLNRRHSIKYADEVLRAIPSGLLYGVSSYRPQFAPDQTIGLTVAGALATGRAQRELELFRLAVRMAADIEYAHEPVAAGPSHGLEAPNLTADQVGQQLIPTEAERAPLLARLAALLRAEQWGWSSYSGGDPWSFAISRQVRPYREIRDIKDYWEIQQQRATPAVTPIAVAPTSPAPGPTVAPVPSKPVTVTEILTVIVPLMGLLFALPFINTSMVRVALCTLLAAAIVAIWRPWRTRTWVRWVGVGAAAISTTALVWSLTGELPGKSSPPVPEPNAQAPSEGSCLPTGTTICRYLRLARDQQFNLTQWGQANSYDIRLAAADTLATVNGRRMSKGLAQEGPLDPRLCWTAGNWAETQQVLTTESRVCIWTPSGHYALVTLVPKPSTAPYAALFVVAITTDKTPVEPPANGRTVVVDNRVTDGARVREDEPAYLASKPRLGCADCVISGTYLLTGARINAVCQTQGDQITNGDLQSADDDANPELRSSKRWYGIRWPDGRSGLLHETWIRKEDRGGLQLPVCQ
ncbi:hypothetical protein [Micromonospora sp. ATA51]|uniref:hypothetical protein n=1 Tax=Micromonospora sp. ATA51 TaxID=2806098 RepID=UPI001A3F3BD1|nr:hypothetical protein [Micromonospora sp. ATA51]MBM0226143.1 hypothetical protein [Micromonospora sp. ATA51]